MTIKDKLNIIVERYNQVKEHIVTEESTKHTLIIPFINALGYDVYNPLEVTPEFIADIGIKKAEKVDYAIKHNNKISILVECKHCTNKLDTKDISQLFRYFHTCDSKLSVLTNGLDYYFFTDLESTNIMDQVPFYILNILNIKDEDIEILNNFTKENFNTDKIISIAKELKNYNNIKTVLESYWTNPNENFVNCVLKDLEYSGNKTQQIVNTYSKLIKDTYIKLFTEKFGGKIKESKESNDIVTTQEELEAYEIIKNICKDIVSEDRIIMRDLKNSCTILLDDINRKLIVRLLFNDLNDLKLVLINEKENETISISKLTDIYRYSEQIKNTVLYYEENYKKNKSGDLNA